MSTKGIQAAVETVIRSALEHVGKRVTVPARAGLCSLELSACVRILGMGEPITEFTSASQLAGCCAGKPEGTLILFFLVRCPGALGVSTPGLYTEAVEAAWGTELQGRGVGMPGGYQGWVGPLPHHWLSLVAA